MAIHDGNLHSYPRLDCKVTMPDQPPTPDEIRAMRDQLGLSRPEFAGHLLGYTDEEIHRANKIISMTFAIKQWELGLRTPSPKHTRLLFARKPSK